MHRSESMASSSGARTANTSSSSGRTTSSSKSSSTGTGTGTGTGDGFTSRLFVQRNGRSYFSDPNNPYPLPTDITETHRQTLRTMLLIQLFGAPTACPALVKKPPTRVLEIGCGSGFWSILCHQYYKARGYSGISFTGIDIVPMAPENGHGIDSDMNWKFIQADLLQWPWPVPDGEYDLIISKDMSFLFRNSCHQKSFDELIRAMRPGGILEIWDSDHLIRMLRPHQPKPSSSSGSGSSSGSSHEADDEQLAASSLGVYVINANTPLTAPLNPYLVEYNQWLTSALESRQLTAVPCTLIGPSLLQESESLTEVRSRRLAIPLGDVRWEREGVGGVVTKDGKPKMDSGAGEQGAATPKVDRKPLSAGQMALRQTAMLTVVQMVQALEPTLREASGKSQDEWDAWLGKMMGDLVNDGGASYGECLEVGAWSAKKRLKPLVS